MSPCAIQTHSTSHARFEEIVNGVESAGIVEPTALLVVESAGIVEPTALLVVESAGIVEPTALLVGNSSS